MEIAVSCVGAAARRPLAAACQEKEEEGQRSAHPVVKRGEEAIGDRRIPEVVLLLQAVKDAAPRDALLTPLHDRPEECRNSPHTRFDDKKGNPVNPPSRHAPKIILCSCEVSDCMREVLHTLST